MREQFADLFTVLQDGRDFADVIAPKLPFMFAMAAKDVYYLHIFQHLVEGDTGDKRFTLTCLANAGCPCQNT
jgi:hypothetical protein